MSTWVHGKYNKRMGQNDRIIKWVSSFPGLCMREMGEHDLNLHQIIQMSIILLYLHVGRLSLSKSPTPHILLVRPHKWEYFPWKPPMLVPCLRFSRYFLDYHICIAPWAPIASAGARIWSFDLMIHTSQVLSWRPGIARCRPGCVRNETLQISS
jgi:hypothetical protein